MIVIKPNLCYYYHPSTGEVTDPRFIGVLIDVLRNIFPSNPEIHIVESEQLSLASREGLGVVDFVPVGDFDYFKRNFPRKGMKENLFERCAVTYLKLLHKG